MELLLIYRILLSENLLGRGLAVSQKKPTMILGDNNVSLYYYTDGRLAFACGSAERCGSVTCVH